MTTSSRRRFRLATASFSLLTLLVAACGSSEDDGSAIPDFVGPGSTTPGSTTPGSTTPGSTTPGTTPAAAPGGETPVTPGDPGATGTPPTEAPGDLPLDGVTPPDPGQTPTAQDPGTPGEQPQQPGEQPGEQPAVAADPDRPTRGTSNLFTDLLGIPVGEVDAKVRTAVDRVFGIGTNEPMYPMDQNNGYRLYYELPQDPSKAFIWGVDGDDVRSEGQSYGMMIAVQMNMQEQFDKLWKFAKENMQITGGVWNRYFNWQGLVNENGNTVTVNFNNSGPAPDGDEYFAAALFLADRRWGSNGAVNYEAEADAIASAMLNNTSNNDQTAIINPQSNMVVFYPRGASAQHSDPSYHLPAFYEIFAQDGNPADANRWRQIAEVSRQYFVTSANATTGLHPDYAAFGGAPVNGGGGDPHDHFRYDAWRVPMNMAIDYAWTGADQRFTTQVDKYHAFFANNGFVGADNVTQALFQLNGQLSGDGGGSSTALTQTLGSAALATTNAARVQFVENAWNVYQQTGLYRYYQQCVYLLGLLATSGWYGYEWAPPAQ